MISIHPPRAGRDIARNNVVATPVEFQSTRPVRGGTISMPPTPTPTANFNPPAPCGAGQFGIATLVRPGDFNPPAPCGAGPPCMPLYFCWIAFQSTRPVRGGTCHALFMDAKEPYFNPPAPCGAGHSAVPAFTYTSNDFNPPAPCGAGLQSCTKFIPCIFA